MKKKRCLVCSKYFKVYKYRFDSAKYCSVKCRNIGIAGETLNTGKTHFKKGHIPWNKGKRVSKKCLWCGKKYSVIFARKNKTKYCGWKCKQLALNIPRRGEKSHLWKGGITPENKRQRGGMKFINFKRTVLNRDNNKCTRCGFSDNLEVHHIKPFYKYKNLRFSPDNGITLCKFCHAKIDKRRNI